jgi:hypothetical protein
MARNRKKFTLFNGATEIEAAGMRKGALLVAGEKGDRGMWEGAVVPVGRRGTVQLEEALVVAVVDHARETSGEDDDQ